MYQDRRVSGPCIYMCHLEMSILPLFLRFCDSFEWGSCCSIFIYMCSVLQIFYFTFLLSLYCMSLYIYVSSRDVDSSSVFAILRFVFRTVLTVWYFFLSSSKHSFLSEMRLPHVCFNANIHIYNNWMNRVVVKTTLSPNLKLYHTIFNLQTNQGHINSKESRWH
jgi:hypothetical protein